MDETKSVVFCAFCGEAIEVDKLPLAACPHCDTKFPVVEKDFWADPRQQHKADPRRQRPGRRENKPL